jgi:hypothetical protein
MSYYLAVAVVVIMGAFVAIALHRIYFGKSKRRPRAILYGQDGLGVKLDFEGQQEYLVERGSHIVIGILLEKGEDIASNAIMIDMHCKKDEFDSPLMYMGTYPAKMTESGRAKLVIDPTVYLDRFRRGFRLYKFWTSFGSDILSNNLTIRIE